MIESFVDLTYRGLALGRRIKLTQVRPTSGYLELPMPMPVGTLVAIATDEGVALEAVVTSIHEQVGGSDRVPGMTVRPALGGEAALGWWQARVALPEQSEVEEPARSRPITVRPRTHTIPAPPPDGAASEPPSSPPPPTPLSKEVTDTKELSVFVVEQQTLPVAPPPPAPSYEPPPARPQIKEEDIKRTTVMNAVDQELLAKLTSSDGEVEHLVRRTGEHAVVDDGLRTTVMDAVDPAALGLDVSASGSFPASSVGEIDADDDDGNGNGNGSDKPKPGGNEPRGKKRKKRR